MTKHKHSVGFRRAYDEVKHDILTIISIELGKHPDNEIQLDDHRGSLVVNQIDDQEAEVIQSIYLKYAGNNTGKAVARIGVYEEDYTQDLEDYEVPFLLNILEAVERALEE